ncbi:MAG: RluA family pseudouridine synthase [Chloroflexi bacterium]|nr:RluA family pseudouridine synthase [Chloroflexota bacterium]
MIELKSPGGLRLDVLLTQSLPDVSRAEVQRWIKEGAVSVGGRPSRASDRPEAGVAIHVTPPDAAPAAMQAEAIPLQIVYEDDDLLVVDKPAGLTVHPGAGAPSGTLANALLAHCGPLSVIGGQERPGIVHRLDRDTSGLLVVAKNDSAHRSLARQIASKTAGRQYLAIAWGLPAWDHAVVRAPIGRDAHHRTRMAVVAESEGGRAAESLLDVQERLRAGCVLTAALRTGRTHQIRVHCASSGIPLVGDPVYGHHTNLCQVVQDPAVREALLHVKRQALHACFLSFKHPRTAEPREFRSSPPADWQQILELMRRA